MIFGIGTDIIEVERVKKKIEADTGFREKVFTHNEILYCESQTNKSENYAARFAAKEAFFKALGIGWRGELSFHEIEICKDEWGKPQIVLHGKIKNEVEMRSIKEMHLSLTHLKSLAQAIVILEK